MRSIAQRRAAYDARMQSSQIDPSLTARNPHQVSKHAAHVAEFYPRQQTLRAYIATLAIAGPAVFRLEALSCEAYAIHRRFSGPAAQALATTLAHKYELLGVPAVQICGVLSQVWGISLVAPAQPVLVSPPDLAPAEPKDGNLVWGATADATGYDVWLGPNAGPVIEVSHDQPGVIYAYAGLGGLTLHDWFVYGRNLCGLGPVSATWQFTTVA